MSDRYPSQNEALWPFVLVAAAFWALAIFMLRIEAEFMAMLLFLFGLSMILPNLFYGREGIERFERWVEWFR